MKALILKRPASIEGSPLVVADLPIPELGPHQLLLRVQTCGLCHTDLHMVEGDIPLPELPIVPGHQIVGVAQELGQMVSWPSVGDRVGVGWLHSACGECSFCQRGLENLCPHGRFAGYHVNGGYAQYMVVPAAFTYPIPEGFSSEQAAPLLCGGVIGYRALRLSEVRPGQVLGLYGFGASAHIAIQVALHWGCRVYVFTRGVAHQELARRLGASWAGQSQEGAPKELDGAIIFAPAGDLVLPALRALGRGGTLVLAGITMSPIPEIPYELIYGERAVRSVANATRQDAKDLLRLVVAIPIRTEVRTFPLVEANRGLQLLKEGGINGAGVLVVSEE